MKTVHLSRIVAIAAILAVQWGFGGETHGIVEVGKNLWEVTVDEGTHTVTAQFPGEPTPYQGDPKILGGSVFEYTMRKGDAESIQQDIAEFQMVVSQDLEKYKDALAKSLVATADQVLDEYVYFGESSGMNVDVKPVAVSETKGVYDWTAKVSYSYARDGNWQLVGVRYVRLILTQDLLVLALADTPNPYVGEDCIVCYARSFVKTIALNLRQ